MRLFNCLTSVVAGVGLLAQSIAAHSTSRNPLNYLSLIESPSIETFNHRVHAYSNFDLTFDLHQHQQHILLKLEPNLDILHDNAHLEIVDAQGRVVSVEKIERGDHLVYHGKTFVIESDGKMVLSGRARIVVRRDGVKPLFEGAFQIWDDHHHIQLKSSYMATKHVQDPELEEDEDEYMVVWRDTDVSFSSMAQKRSVGRSCAADSLSFNTNPNHPVFNPKFRRDEGYWGAMPFGQILGKRQSIDGGTVGNGNSAGVNLRNNIGSTAGCPNTRKVALVGVATDCGYTAGFNSTDSMKKNIIAVINTASDLYQSTFNITLALANLTVSDASCPGTAVASTPWNVACTSNTDMTQRLSLFSQWRGQRNDNNAYWSLFTTCTTGNEVGLAWLGQLCNRGTTAQESSQHVTGANVVARTPNEWQVFAHETGHTFGAVHDCDSSACSNANAVAANQCCPYSTSACDAGAQFMMNPYSSSRIQKFSACSVGNICNALGRNSVTSTCLTDNKNVVTVTGAVCGNGIVEDGEDCDCGGATSCSGNPCCNPATCKFTTNSVCDPSNDQCCTRQCRYASAGTVCRASTGVCDPAETCSGTTGACPADQTAQDGTDCGGSLRCASGQCTSRDLQCRESLGAQFNTNDTYACNDDACTITCGSPVFGPRVCYSNKQNFLDGTPCKGDGSCKNGVCEGSSTGGQIRSWVSNNKTLVIALSAGIGGLLLIAVLGCIIRACRRPRKKRGVPVAAAAAGRSRRGNRQSRNQPAWDGPVVPPEMQQRGYGSPPPNNQQSYFQQGNNYGFGDQWQASNQYQSPYVPPQQQQNYGSSPNYPPPPPPTYQNPPLSPNHGGYVGGSSVRYA